ncbi:MAG TPA: cysteine desulfurase [Candidatus Gallacutalibacter pullistercoris]|nr:cysteine desulfurase [Candidatus Gallacutalibacter pullistercoris]
MQEIYLDNSATTRVCPEAAQKALEIMTECYGNPSSLHTMGFRADQELSAARKAVAGALSALPEEITFTSGGTEANNLAIFGAAWARRQHRRIVTTAIEHPSVLACMAQLEKEGWQVVYLQPDSFGRISPQQVEEAITPDTALVSMMAVNNEVGSILPIETSARVIRRNKARTLLHVDAVQAFGKLPLKPGKIGVDLMTVSAHKIHGPKGAGALYIRKGVHIPARTLGGGQEKDLRSGTEAMPAWCAFGAAVKALPPIQQEEAAIRTLWQSCREGIKAIPGTVIQSPEDGLPYILNFSCGGVKAETMLHFLEERGIYVSSGSACAKGKASHVLEAMQLPRQQALSSIRVSFSRENTPEEVTALIQAVREGMETLVRAYT